MEVGKVEVISFVVVVSIVEDSREPVMYPVIGMVRLELFSGWVWLEWLGEEICKFSSKIR